MTDGGRQPFELASSGGHLSVVEHLVLALLRGATKARGLTTNEGQKLKLLDLHFAAKGSGGDRTGRAYGYGAEGQKLNLNYTWTKLGLEVISPPVQV